MTYYAQKSKALVWFRDEIRWFIERARAAGECGLFETKKILLDKAKEIAQNCRKFLKNLEAKQTKV